MFSDCYLGIMQLALQAADLLRKPKRFGVRGRQIAGKRLNLTLRGTEEGNVSTQDKIQEDLCFNLLDHIQHLVNKHPGKLWCLCILLHL